MQTPQFSPLRTGVLLCADCVVFYVPAEFSFYILMQEELDDDDEWNPCKAAGVCLMLLATCCEDDIVPHVLPFVKEHIKNPDWRFRDAAVMAFGKLVDETMYRFQI